MNTSGKRLRDLLDEQSIAYSEFASAMGVEPQHVNNWFKRGIPKSRTFQVADYLSVDARWLAEGIGTATPADEVPTDSESVTVLRRAGRRLPVIGSIAAGAWCEATALQPADIEDWIESPGPVGPRAFVLKIEGISMFNPNGPISFADGDHVVIDPDIEPLPGDFVVARLSSSNRATFKRLRQDEGEWYLEAINPAWDPRYIRVTEEWHICGKAKWKVQSL
ncbi:putative HTH-type transcriptional regulator [compost metagenome]